MPNSGGSFADSDSDSVGSYPVKILRLEISGQWIHHVHQIDLYWSFAIPLNTGLTMNPKSMNNDVQKRDTTSASTTSIPDVSRRTFLKAGALTGGILAVSGCATVGEAQKNDGSDPTGGLESIRIPQLHLATFEAEVQGETLQAVAYDEWRSGSTSYVGQVSGRRNADLFVGVSLPGEDAEQYTETVVYLCDGEIGAFAETGIYMTGDYAVGGATFTENVLSVEDDSEVRLALVDGELLGAVTLADNEQFPFISAEATGKAGLYAAETREGDLLVLWIVLPDGRQRGFSLDGKGNDIPPPPPRLL